MIASIEDLFNGNKVKNVLKRGLISIGLIGIAAFIYLCLTKIACEIRGITLSNAYNGLTHLFSAPTDVISLLKNTYVTCAYSVVFSIHNSSKFSFFVHCLLVCPVIFIGLKVLFSKDITIGAKFLLILLVLLLPFAMNISFFADGGMEHDLMEYAFFLAYLLFIIVVLWFDEQKEKKLPKIVVCICLTIVLVAFTQNANVVYILKNFENEATLSIMSNVSADIEKTEGYIPGETKVAFIGSPSLYRPYAYGNYLTTGVGSGVITYYSTYEKYFIHILQKPLLLCGETEKDNILCQNSDISLQCYPKNGYIQWIDDVLFVKMS